MRSFLKAFAALCGVSAGLLVVASTYFPHLKTSLDYSYTFVTPHAYVLYGIGIAILIFALIADKLNGLANRLVLVPVLLIGGLIVHSVDFTDEGSLWAARQAAFDTPIRNASVDLESFWQELHSVTGNSNIQSLVEAWGVHVTFNDAPVYQNAIFSLPQSAADRLLEAAGTPQTYYEQGFFLLVLALVSQLLSALLIWVTPKPKA